MREFYKWVTGSGHFMMFFICQLCQQLRLVLQLKGKIYGLPYKNFLKLKKLDKQSSEGLTFDYFNKPTSCMFETLPVCAPCRHTSADADSRPQRTCGPSASIRLRLPGACRIQSASSSARLRLRHVKTPAPFSPHTGWSYHPSISHSPSPDHYCLCLPSTGSWG